MGTRALDPNPVTDKQVLVELGPAKECRQLLLRQSECVASDYLCRVGRPPSWPSLIGRCIRTATADQLPAKQSSAKRSGWVGKRAVVLKQLAEILCLEHLTTCLAACERPGSSFRLRSTVLPLPLSPRISFSAGCIVNAFSHANYRFNAAHTQSPDRSRFRLAASGNRKCCVSAA